MEDDDIIAGEVGLEVISDDHPSFFIVKPYHQEWVDIGWLDVPGVSKWRFTSQSNEEFMRATLRALVATMAGRYTDSATIDQLANTTKQVLQQSINAKQLIPYSTPSIVDHDAEAKRLMVYFAPRATPRTAVLRYLGEEEGENSISRLRESGWIIGVQWIGGVRLYTPSGEVR